MQTRAGRQWWQHPPFNGVNLTTQRLGGRTQATCECCTISCFKLLPTTKGGRPRPLTFLASRGNSMKRRLGASYQSDECSMCL